MVSEKIRTKQATIWVDEEGICRIVLDEGTVLELEDVKELVALQYELLDDGSAPLLVDMSGIKSSSRAALEYTVRMDQLEIVSALALVEDSVVGRIIGNAYMNFQKPPYPTRLFNSEEKALVWLRGFLED